jgi:hypothetical protein
MHDGGGLSRSGVCLVWRRKAEVGGDVKWDGLGRLCGVELWSESSYVAEDSIIDIFMSLLGGRRS